VSALDWWVLIGTLTVIIGYGLYKGGKQTGAESYLLADRQMPWYIILLGIMATQASAITFLSAPGQAYNDGMRFLQYYFGLPLAMIVISATFIPVFRKMKVFTAYEFLEQRFDRRTRLLTSVLFLLSRGLSTGISIYAPAIILSSILGLNIYLANVLTGGLLIIHTYSGGAKAVAHTQKVQFLIILAAMALAGYLVVAKLPTGVGFSDALYIAGKTGKLNVITTSFDLKDKYNLWSGLIGGFFLALSYFGTDHSQVGRYITARSDKQGREGLLLNGLIKIPMQFLILLIGALVFAFYSFYPSPMYFNTTAVEQLHKQNPKLYDSLSLEFNTQHAAYQQSCLQVAAARNASPSVALVTTGVDSLRSGAKSLTHLRRYIASRLTSSHYTPDKDDSNYIFLYFVKTALPTGLVGLIFAVIILASWGSISAALNALAASSLMDVHLIDKKQVPEAIQLKYGRIHTLAWGIFSIGVAMFAAQLGSLIEAVNVLGSLFYGTILGIFVVAFYLKKIDGRTVFLAALISEAAVVIIFFANVVSFLWLNVIGTLLVVCLSLLIRSFLPTTAKSL
jgi:solute:Na+ symporter, SSS family